MIPPVEKRTVDMQIIADWVEPHTRVLDPPSAWTSTSKKSPPASVAASPLTKAT